MREHFLRIMRFIIAGLAATGANISTFYALAVLMRLWYVPASMMGFLAGFFVSFTLQKFWTFQDRGTERIGGQVTKYFLLFLFNLGLSTGVVYLLVEYIQIAPIIAQLFAAATIACYSFFVYKFFVFHRDQDPQQPEGQDAA